MKIKTNVRAGKQNRNRGAGEVEVETSTSSSSSSTTTTPVAPYVPTTYIRCGVTITY